MADGQQKNHLNQQHIQFDTSTVFYHLELQLHCVIKMNYFVNNKYDLKRHEMDHYIVLVGECNINILHLYLFNCSNTACSVSIKFHGQAFSLFDKRSFQNKNLRMSKPQVNLNIQGWPIWGDGGNPTLRVIPKSKLVPSDQNFFSCPPLDKYVPP